MNILYALAVAVRLASPQTEYVPPVNAMDAPGRCPTNQLSVSEDDFGWDKQLTIQRAKAKGVPTDAFLIDMILNGDIRMSPLPVIMTFLAETDYMGHRKELQEKFEKAIEALPDAKAKTRGYNNYAMALVYLGEFQKVIDFFGPSSPKHAELVKQRDVPFALANAYWRLHKWEEANQFSKAALAADEALDTKWMMMVSDVGLYGDDFETKRDPKLYESKHIREIFPVRDWSRLPFDLVGAKMGMDLIGGTGSVSFFDLDGDGWDDLIYERKFFPFQIYKNNQGKFSKVDPSKMGHDNCSMIVAPPGDYDNDGKPDIFRHCCNYDGAGPTVLLHNKGELSFEDVTKQSGLEFTKGYGMVASWADYDLDGYLDLVVGDANGSSRLYHNTGHGTFVDVTKKAGVHTPGQAEKKFGTVGTTWGDLDGDGYPDLFIQGWGWKKLFMNNKNGTFRDVTAKSGLNMSPEIKGYTNQIFDYDGDGKLDLYTGQYVVASAVQWGFSPLCTCSNLLGMKGYEDREWKHASTIYRNNGNGTFTDMSAKTHFIPLGTMGADNGDWDNDGDQDVVQGAGGPYFQQAEPFLFYENKGDGTFELVTPFTDLRLWGKGHGGTFADYDHDGNLDLVLNNGGATPGDVWPSLVLHNKGNANHWLEVGFKAAPGTNASAIGARVVITAGGRSQIQEFWSGGRFAAANGSRVHFGLGKNTKIDKVEIRWPNKKLDTTVLTNLDVDQAIEVDEASGKSRQLWTFPHGEGLKNAKEP